MKPITMVGTWQERFALVAIYKKSDESRVGNLLIGFLSEVLIVCEKNEQIMSK